MIYFIQSGDNGSIKIGETNNINRRLATLQVGTSEKLTLLGFLDNDLETEKDMHLKFSEYRLRGEWFKPAKELLEYIQNNCKEVNFFQLVSESTKEIFCNCYGELMVYVQSSIKEENELINLRLLKYNLEDFVKDINEKIEKIH